MGLYEFPPGKKKKEDVDLSRRSFLKKTARMGMGAVVVAHETLSPNSLMQRLTEKSDGFAEAAEKIPKGASWNQGLEHIYQWTDTQEYESGASFINVGDHPVSGWYSPTDFEGVGDYKKEPARISLSPENAELYAHALADHLDQSGISREEPITISNLHTHPRRVLVDAYSGGKGTNSDSGLDFDGKIVAPPSNNRGGRNGDIVEALNPVGGFSHEIYKTLKERGFENVELDYLVSDPELVYRYDRYESEEAIVSDFPELESEFEEDKERQKAQREVSNLWTQELADFNNEHLEQILTSSDPKFQQIKATLEEEIDGFSESPSSILSLLSEPDTDEVLLYAEQFYGYGTPSFKKEQFYDYKRYFVAYRELKRKELLENQQDHKYESFTTLWTAFIWEANKHPNEELPIDSMKSWQKLRVWYARQGVEVKAKTRAEAISMTPDRW